MDGKCQCCMAKVRIKNLTLTPGAPSPDTEVGPWIDAYQMQVFSTDYAPYSFYLYKQLYDAETGQPIEGLYADLDGDGEITNKDRYHHHSPAPDWILGFQPRCVIKSGHFQPRLEPI